MTKKKLSDIVYQLKNIEIFHTTLNVPEITLGKKINYNFNINIEHKFNLDSNNLIVVCSISISSQSKEELYGSIKTGCVFEVPQLKQFINLETKVTEVPKHLNDILNTISLSTTRGIMFSTFRGTFLHNAVLPIIDLNALEQSKEKLNYDKNEEQAVSPETKTPKKSPKERTFNKPK